MSRRLSFTEDRRRKLRRQPDQFRLEPRTTITEPISFTGLAVSWMRGVVGQLGLISPFMGSNALSGLGRQVQKANQAQDPTKPAFAPGRNLLAPITGAHASEIYAGGGGSHSSANPGSNTAVQATSNDWLSLTVVPATDQSEHGISLPWHPAKPNGGGAAMAPRGGSNPSNPIRNTSRGAITPLQLPPSTPAASSAGGSAALLAAAASASGNSGALTAGPAPHAATSGAAPSPGNVLPTPITGSKNQGPGTNAPGQNPQGASPFTASGGSPPPGSTPDPVTGNSSPPTQQTFAYFPMYVLDINNGVTLYPGVNQLARLGGLVDLEAQVSGATVSSYNWNTTGLGTDVTNLSVTNTYLLSFNWTTSNPSSTHTDSVTLSVTDSNSHTETFTYDFLLPAGSATQAGSLDTWPTSLPPSSELISAPSFDSDNASVDATSGSLDTEIDLPSYNPNVPALALTYDSIAASPTPIVVFENTLSASAAVPSKVSAQLTFNSTALTNYYFSTTQLNPGDVQQIALEATNATTLTTNRYAYSAQVVDIGTTNTTSTYSGSTTLLNDSGSAFGAGWTLQGLEKITAETGGVILDLGQGGRTLWFTGSFGSGGGTFTDPAGEFSTLVQNSGGSYTDTLTDGTQIQFSSAGAETDTIDLNNQHITYSYSGGNLISIEDNYANFTTLSYSGGYLQTIKDPASRVTTFTHSGGNLTEATLPDSSTWNYAYASGGQLTQITDPRSHTVTIAYDSASRVGTISRPDSTHETFTNDQESGWTNSGTLASPAAPTLLAQAGGTYTSPNSNTTTIQPDWMGLGMTGNQIDALGDVQMYDLNSNGLATVAVDQVNRVTSFAYDSSGNMTKVVYPDGNSESYTFNSDSQPLTFVDANANTTSYTYSGGNLVVVKDPMGNLTSMG
jgi:YD repeat-containing protein